MRTRERVGFDAEAPEEIVGRKVHLVSAELKVAAVSVMSCGLALLAAAVVDNYDLSPPTLGAQDGPQRGGGYARRVGTPHHDQLRLVHIIEHVLLVGAEGGLRGDHGVGDVADGADAGGVG